MEFRPTSSTLFWVLDDDGSETLNTLNTWMRDKIAASLGLHLMQNQGRHVVSCFTSNMLKSVYESQKIFKRYIMAIFNSYVCLPKGTFKRLEPQPEIPAHAWCMQMLTPKILEVRMVTEADMPWRPRSLLVVCHGLPLIIQHQSKLESKLFVVKLP